MALWMWPPTSTRRSPAALVLTLLLMTGYLPVGQAAAQSGNGLYEPFPEAAVKKRAQRYVDGLRSRTARPSRRYSNSELAEGVFVRANPREAFLRRTGMDALPGAATGRAGGGGGADVALPLQLLLLTFAVALPGAAAVTWARMNAA